MVVSGPKFLQSVLGDLVQIALGFSKGRTFSKAQQLETKRLGDLWIHFADQSNDAPILPLMVFARKHLLNQRSNSFRNG